MPLTRGTIIGFNASRMSYHFTMTDGQRVSAALDELAGQRSKPPRAANRDAEFLELRDQIEELVRDRLDSEGNPKLVRIFAKHIPKSAPGS
jgi:hypothetical protein